MSANERRKRVPDLTYSGHTQDLAFMLAVAIEEGCTDIEVSTEYGRITAAIERPPAADPADVARLGRLHSVRLRAETPKVAYVQCPRPDGGYANITLAADLFRFLNAGIIPSGHHLPDGPPEITERVVDTGHPSMFDADPTPPRGTPRGA